jgi:hypothetical protein
LVWISDMQFAFFDWLRNSSRVVLVALQNGLSSARVATGVVGLPTAIDVLRLE